MLQFERLKAWSYGSCFFLHKGVGKSGKTVLSGHKMSNKMTPIKEWNFLNWAFCWEQRYIIYDNTRITVLIDFLKLLLYVVENIICEKEPKSFLGNVAWLGNTFRSPDNITSKWTVNSCILYWFTVQYNFLIMLTCLHITPITWQSTGGGGGSFTSHSPPPPLSLSLSHTNPSPTTQIPPFPIFHL